MKRFAFLALFASGAASALCLTESYAPVAWNYTGTGVLINRKVWGPEGGGSNSFIVLNLRSQRAEEFYLSSNFREGGDTRERISEAECRRHVAAVNRRLTELNLRTTFKTGPLDCRARREDPVELRDTPSVRLPEAQVKELTSKAEIPSEGLELYGPKNAANDFPGFVVISNNKKCDAKYFIMLFNPADKSYRVYKKF